MNKIDGKLVFSASRIDANEPEENIRFLWAADTNQFQAHMIKGMGIDISNAYELEQLILLAKKGDIMIDYPSLKDVFKVDQKTLYANNIRLI